MVDIMSALNMIFVPMNLLGLFFGVLVGIAFGCMPGLSVNMGLALLFPLVGIFLPSYCDTVAGWMEGSYFAADLYNNNLLLILIGCIVLLLACSAGLAIVLVYRSKAMVSLQNSDNLKPSFCPYCGAKHKDGEKFCKKCGKELK